MRIKWIGLLTLAAILLSSSLCLAAFSQKDWHYYKELQVDSDGFTTIKLDPDIMKNCQKTFADLRVTDSQGHEIPSQIIPPNTEEIVSETSLINMVDYPAYSSAMIDLGPNPKPHNRIILNVKNDDDFWREVELQASADSNNWGTLTTGKIFSYEGEQASQISYPTSNMRYLRINIKNNPTEKPLKIISAQLKYLPTNLYEGKLITAKMISNRSDKESTKLIVDLGVPNYIVTGMQIKTSDRNFNRRVECATSDKAIISGEEVPLKSERVLSYKWNNYLSIKDSIEVNQYSKRYLIITIFNGNSPPLNISGISVYGCTPTLIADLRGPSRLWYGNPKAEVPTYDLYEFANLIQKNDLKVVQAGQEQLNPDYQAPVIPWTEKNKWLLDTIIILVAAGFIFFIIRNFKKIKDKDNKQDL